MRRSYRFWSVRVPGRRRVSIVASTLAMSAPAWWSTAAAMATPATPTMTVTTTVTTTVVSSRSPTEKSGSARKTNRHRRARRPLRTGAGARRRHRFIGAGRAAGSTALSSSRTLEAVPAASSNPSTAGATPSTTTSRTTTAPGTADPLNGAVGSSSGAVAALDRLVQLMGAGDYPSAALVRIDKAAGRRYHIRWEILAAINAIETDYGRNVATSSAGALGWMQFMPATWLRYGVAAMVAANRIRTTLVTRSSPRPACWPPTGACGTSGRPSTRTTTRTGMSPRFCGGRG